MYTEITVMSYTYLYQTVGLAIQIKFLHIYLNSAGQIASVGQLL